MAFFWTLHVQAPVSKTMHVLLVYQSRDLARMSNQSISPYSYWSTLPAMLSDGSAKSAHYPSALTRAAVTEGSVRPTDSHSQAI